ncbi:hypothetical protein ACJ73_06741 [Blastomyces percursus]|uniref:Uncharacterized protein n=1 Tax=Blastomyces percursus TaxID=1658174 RepID=A0A1J9R1I9_9EURO|nr:hypothetical protein ACJ73_06741 [Blastomyces percursus]
MAAFRTLLDYLMVAPPGLPTKETNKTPNTTNDQCNWRQINSVSVWHEFTYDHIRQRYGHLLQQVLIESAPMPNSPPQPVNTEPMFAVRFTTYVQSRLRRALRAVDIGDAAQVINNFRPDIAFSELAVHSVPRQIAAQEI